MQFDINVIYTFYKRNKYAIFNDILRSKSYLSRKILARNKTIKINRNVGHKKVTKPRSSYRIIIIFD